MGGNCGWMSSFDSHDAHKTHSLLWNPFKQCNTQVIHLFVPEDKRTIAAMKDHLLDWDSQTTEETPSSLDFRMLDWTKTQIRLILLYMIPFCP